MVLIMQLAASHFCQMSLNGSHISDPFATFHIAPLTSFYFFIERTLHGTNYEPIINNVIDSNFCVSVNPSGQFARMSIWGFVLKKSTMIIQSNCFYSRLHRNSNS